MSDLVGEFSFHFAEVRAVWKFRTMGRSEVNEDPQQQEFFAPEEGFAGALVREAVQNSLDAKIPGEPLVRMRFAFGRVSVEQNRMRDNRYFEGLHRHLTAQELSYLPELHQPIEYLLVEDFGTRGLRGDPEQSADAGTARREKNDFYYFWRNVGRSVKHASERGRWGLGKTVFPASSRVHSFFGFTVRDDDSLALLMGQSVGKIHMMGSEKHAAYGYFADFAQDEFALAIRERSRLSNFATVFGVSRRSEPGLSIVIPFPQEELTEDAILREAIRNFYLPVLWGNLEITVVGLSGEEQVLSKASIRELIERLEWSRGDVTKQEIIRLLAFADEVMAVPTDGFINLRTVGGGSAPSWAHANPQETFESHDLADLRGRFEAGELLALKVPVTVVQQGSTTEASHFLVYLQRDAGLTNGQGDFVRQGLTISQIGKPPKPGTRGLVIVDDPALSSLLGDSENPAHTKWQERSEALKARYRHGPSTVRYVVRSLIELSSMLSRPPAGREEDLLVDLFFVETPPEPDIKKGVKPISTKAEDEPGPGNPPPEITARVPLFRVQRIPGGFKLASNPEARQRPEAIEIEVAYAVRRGNPFKKYRSFDFMLGKPPIRITNTGSEGTVERNKILLNPTADDFAVEATGFDTHRDILIRATSGRVTE